MENLDSILGDSYDWIKVKRYVEIPGEDWESAYNRLKEHHRKEKEFLINTCKGLAKEIKGEDDSELKDDWLDRFTRKHRWTRTLLGVSKK